MKSKPAQQLLWSRDTAPQTSRSYLIPAPPNIVLSARAEVAVAIISATTQEPHFIAPLLSPDRPAADHDHSDFMLHAWSTYKSSATRPPGVRWFLLRRLEPNARSASADGRFG
jgi:hypothetical protein